jgi:hypothetical protein
MSSSLTSNQIPKLHMINPNGITVKECDGGTYELYYNGKPLKCQTGLVNCPYGISEDRKLRVAFDPQAIDVLSHLDKIVSASASADENAEVEHQPLSVTDNEITINVNAWTTFFDNNKVKINGVMDVPISSEFTAFLLLDLSKVYIFEGKIKLYIGLLQVMIRTVSTLPTGCHVFNNLTSLRTYLADGQRDDPEEGCEESSASAASGDLRCDDLRCDDVNELLD